MKEVYEKIHYTFANPALLTQALTHSSYASEHETQDNERLEFLGDSLLGMVISGYLFKRYPDFKEGKLTRLRSRIVNAKTLAKVAKRLELGKHLLLGKGEDKTKGRGKDSNLANALEAIIGAVYCDSDFETTAKVVLAIFEEELKSGFLIEDYKGELQEFCQKQYRRKPVYEVVAEEGMAHKKVFTVAVKVKGEAFGTGTGKNKREAERLAARQALETIVRSRKN